MIQNKKNKLEDQYRYEWEKNERKKASYIRKKEEEYMRKMRNEIREFEWKPKKEIKKKKNLNLIDFASKILQENSRLRDSNEKWDGNCISCGILCHWGKHQWWHRRPRWIKNLTLEPKNINLQCRSCNFATWPQWDTVRKERTNHQYDINLDKKYWEGTSKWLEGRKNAYFRGEESGDYDFDKLIPELIEENKRLWATKSFIWSSKKWERIWDAYKEQ